MSDVFRDAVSKFSLTSLFGVFPLVVFALTCISCSAFQGWASVGSSHKLLNKVLTHEPAQTSTLKRWRSWFPVLYTSIYLKQGGGVFRLGQQAEEISNSSVAGSCIRKVHSCPQAIFVLFLVKTCGRGAEEWCRTLYF